MKGFLRSKAHKGFPIYTWEELVNYLGEKNAHKVVYGYSRVCYAEYHNCPLVRDAFPHVGGFWFPEQQVMTDRKGVVLSGEHTGKKFRDVFSGEKFKFEQKILSFDEYDTAKKLSRERKEPGQASLFKGA
jgi:hypothetical protein